MAITFLDEEEDIVATAEPPKVEGGITFLDEEEPEPATPAPVEVPKITFLDEESKALSIGGLAVPPAPEIPKFEATKPSEGVLRQAADLPVQFAIGINNSVKGLSDLFGADNPVSQNLAQNTDWYRGLLSAAAKQDEQEVGRILQEAEGKGILDQLGAGLEAFTVAPADFVASGLGSLAVFAAGGLAGRAAGLGARGVQAVQAGLGAGMGAGIAKGEIYQSVKDEMLAQGKTEEEAKGIAMEAQSFGGKNLDQILLGAGLGTIDALTGAEKIIGKVLTKGGLKPDASRIGNIIKNGITEAAPEFIQAAQEKFASNLALQREGVDVSLTQGVFSQGALEGLVGLGMGVGAGAIEPRIQTEPTKEEVSAAAAETQDVARRSMDVAPATASLVEGEAEQIVQSQAETPDERVARLQREAQEAAGEIELEEEGAGLPPVEPTPPVTPTPEAAVAPVEPVVPAEEVAQPPTPEAAPTPEIAQAAQTRITEREGQAVTLPEEPTGNRVEAAAYQAPDGTVYYGASHLDAMAKARDAGKIEQAEIDVKQETTSRETPEFGFATDADPFVTRDQAETIARQSGQITVEQPATGKLHSNEVSLDAFAQPVAPEAAPAAVEPTPVATPVTPEAEAVEVEVVPREEQAAQEREEIYQLFEMERMGDRRAGEEATRKLEEWKQKYPQAHRAEVQRKVESSIRNNYPITNAAELDELGITPPENYIRRGNSFVPTGEIVAPVPTLEAPVTPQLEPLRRVARAEQTEKDVSGLVDGGLVELYKGQPVLTQAGLEALPEAERPRLTPEARKIQIDTRTSEAAAEAISKNLRIGVDQVPVDVRMPEGWTLVGDVYVPPQPQAVTKPEVPITPEAVEPSREQIRGLLRELNSVERAAISGRMVEEGIISKEDADRYIFEAVQFGADPRKISDAEEAANEKWDAQKEAYIASGRVAGEVEIPPVDHTAEESERAKQPKVDPRTALDPVEFNGLTAREALLKLASMNFGASEYEATGRELSMDMTLQRVASALSKLPLRGLDAELILFSKKRTGDFLAYRAHAGNIYIPQTSGGKKAYISPQTLVHEIGHTLTLDAFNKYIKASGVKAGEPYYKNLERALKAKNTPRPVKKIIALYIETIDQLGLRDMYFGKKGLANDDAPESRKRARERKDRPINPITGEPFTFSQLYGLANIDEFVSETFSNPAFQDFVKTISVDGGQRSAWRKFVEAIRELFGFPSKSIAEQVVNSAIQAAGLEAETMYGRTVAQRLQDIADAKKKKIQQGIVDQEKAKIKLSWKKSTSDWGAQLHNATYKFPKKNPIADMILIEIEKDATGYGGYMISVEGKKDGSFVDLSKYLKGVYGITSLKNAKDVVLTAIYDISLTTGRPAPEVISMAPRTNEEQIAFEKASSNKVLARNPELAVAAVRLKNGEITAGEYADLVDAIDPFIAKGADQIPTQEKIKQYIAADKAPMVGVEIENGKEVEFRIDIPTYNRSTANGDPVYAITAHEPVSEDAKRVGAPISYMGVAKATNPTFITRAISGKGAAIEIAMGAGKFPLATVKGNYEAITDLPEDINNPEIWTEVGYNPIRSSFFVDTRSGDAVISGSEAIMVGSRVFVKNAEMEPRPRDITMGGRYAPEPEGGFPTFTEGTPEAATLKAMETSMAKVDAASEAKGGKPETQKISDIAANWMDQGGDERALQDAIVENTNLTPANAARVARAIAKQYGLQQQIAETGAVIAEIAPEPEGAPRKSAVTKLIEQTTGVRKPVVKLQVSESAALKKQIQLKAREARETRKARKEAAEELAKSITDYVKENPIRGPINSRQAMSITKKALKLDVNNEAAVDRFEMYVERVIENANYDQDLADARALIKRAKTFAKAKDTQGNVKTTLEAIANIAPTLLDNPFEFNLVVQRYLLGLAPVTAKQYAVMPDADVRRYLESLETQIKDNQEVLDRSKAQRILDKQAAYAEEKGIPLDEAIAILNSEEFLQEKTIEKLEDLTKLLTSMAQESQKDVKAYDDSGATPKQKELISFMRKVNLESLINEEKKRYIRFANNLLANGATFGMEQFQSIALGQEAAMKAAKDKRLSNKLAAWISPIGGDKAIDTARRIALRTQSEADTFKNIFGREAVGAFRNILGLNRLDVAQTDSNRAKEQIANEFGEYFKGLRKKYGDDATGFEAKGYAGIAGYLIQTDGNKTEAESIPYRRRLMEQNIVELRKSDKQADLAEADLKERALAQLTGATNAEILSQLQALNPASYEQLMWVKDVMLPKWRDFLKEHDENFRNQANNYNNPDHLTITYKFPEGQLLPSEMEDVYQQDMIGMRIKQAANSIKRKDHPNLPVSKAGTIANIDINFGYNQYNALVDQVDKAFVAPAWEQVVAFTKAPEFEQVMGGRANALFVKNLLRDIQTSRSRQSLTDDEAQLIAGGVRLARKISTQAVLGGITQPLRQVPDQLAKLFFTTGRFDLITKNLLTTAQAAPLLNKFPIGRRGDAQAGTQYASQFNELARKVEASVTDRKWAQYRELMNKVGEFWMTPLRGSDVWAAKVSWMSYYEAELNKKGIKMESWEREAELVDTDQDRKEAASYAEFAVDFYGGASDPTKMAALSKQSNNGWKEFAKLVFLPLNSFALQQKNSLISDLRDAYLRTGDRKASIAAIAGTLAGMAAFHGMRIYIIGGLIYPAGKALLMGIFGIDMDEPDEEEKQKQLEDNWRKFKASMYGNIIAGGAGEFAEKAAIDAVNRTAYLWDANINPDSLLNDKGEIMSFRQYEKEVSPLYRFRSYGSSEYSFGLADVLTEQATHALAETQQLMTPEEMEKHTGNEQAYAAFATGVEWMYFFRLMDTDVKRIATDLKRQMDKEVKEREAEIRAIRNR